MPIDCLSIWNTGSVYRAVRASPREASTGTVDTSATLGMNLTLGRTFAVTPQGTATPYVIVQYQLPSASSLVDPDRFRQIFLEDLPPIFREPSVMVNGTNLYQNNQRLYDCLLSMTCCAPGATPSTACLQYFQDADASIDCPALETMCASTGSDPTSTTCRPYCDPLGGRCGAAWKAFCDSNDRFQGTACLGYYHASYGEDGRLDPEVVSLLKRRCAPYADADGTVGSTLPMQTCGCFLPDSVYHQYYDGLDLPDAVGSRPNPQCDFPLCTPRSVLPMTKDAECSGDLHECALAVSSQHGIGDPSEATGTVGIQTIRACLTETAPTDDSDDTQDGTEEGFQRMPDRRGCPLRAWAVVGMIGVLSIAIAWVIVNGCRRHPRRHRRRQVS